MRCVFKLCLALGLSSGLAGALVLAAAGKAAPAPNGIRMPQGYEDWRVIGVSDRTDNNTLRVILGNDVAVAAARQGQINPWPDGAVLAKVVWKQTPHKHWEKALVPDEFVHVEFMIKDSRQYGATGGWGYARWRGKELSPYGKDATFVQECVGCHTPVKHQDYVFTRPVIMP